MNERLRILDLIETGEISVDEGLGLLEALGGTEGEVLETPPGTPAEPAAPAVRPAWVRVVWQVVLWARVALLGGGGFLLVNFYARQGSRGLTWGWVLFALGVLVVGLAWWLQRALWFYLRVNEQDGPSFAIGLPMPLGLIGWLLRIGTPFVPQLREMGADELILAMREELRDGRSFAVEIDDEEDGEQVKVYFC